MSKRLSMLLILLLALCGQAMAQGILLPIAGTPRFSIVSQQVKIKMEGDSAKTDVALQIQNNAGQICEATYLFPIPEGMPLADFSLRFQGDEAPATRLSREEAKKVITTLVQQWRDPALLEWMGCEMMQARIPAIPARGQSKIQLAYRQTLPRQNGVVKCVYPLKTAKLSLSPLRDLSINVSVANTPGARAIYSPSHLLEKDTPQLAGALAASYRAKYVLPDEDLLLYYTTSAGDVGMNLLTYTDENKDEGYFQLLVTPKDRWPEAQRQARDIVFVLDTSGSMRAAGKLTKAKAALSYCLRRLGPRDRFSVIAFNTTVNPWQKSLQLAGKDRVSAAEKYFSAIPARGNTNIDGALKEALRILDNEDAHRVRNILFLTDGLPTVGEKNVENILANFAERNTRKARVFDFGVGFDYNAHFLDKLAGQNNGAAENVLPNEGLDKKISGFYQKIAVPLFTDLRLAWGTGVYDVYPQALTDLYAGTTQVIVGRFTPSAKNFPAQVTLTGAVNGETRTFSTEGKIDDTREAFIPRLWATRKLGYMENQMRLSHSDENTLTEIIRLSKEFGILSQYTTFLAEMDYSVPGGPLANAVSKPDRKMASYYSREVGNKIRIPSGPGGISQSYNQNGAMRADQYAPITGARMLDSIGRVVRMSQMRNIDQRTFVRSGSQWMDINYKPEQTLRHVKTFSPAYFQLANAHPRMAHFMSLGQNVTVALPEEAVQFGESGQEAAFAKTQFDEMEKAMAQALGAPEEESSSLARVNATLARLPVWAWPLGAGVLLLLGGFILRRRLTRQVAHE